MYTVRLKKGKEKAVRQKHPWIFSGAIEHVKGSPEDGDIVLVEDHNKEFLAYGFFNHQSRVAIRVLEWEPDIEINESWWRRKIEAAISLRSELLNGQTNTCRLIFSEADFLPGLIVDQYADFLSLQILSSGIEKNKDLILAELNRLIQPKGILDRSDVGARQHEGMQAGNYLLSGIEPPDFIKVKENGLFYDINIREGQKSGFYCDQRDNRRLTATYTRGKKVLDCFCYSGGFSLNALQAGAAHITSVDSSALAIETLKRNMELNGFQGDHVAIQADVNKQLRVFAAQDKAFDLIILDPPKYAPSRSALDKAARAYKDLNRLAMNLLTEGGILVTFSCSGAVDLAEFKRILAWAALDAGKEVQFIQQLAQPQDHPVRSSFPEGEYLKGLICSVKS